MPRTYALAFPMCGWLLAGTLAFAQPTPAKPPQPQDPTPVPAAKPPDVTKPEPTPPRPAPSGRLTRSDLTLRGCLQRDDTPAASNEPGTLGAGFVLRHAALTPSSGAAAAAAQEGTAAKDYRVSGKDDSVKLADHVGHEVEVVGKLALEAESPARATTQAATSASRPSGSTGVATPPSTAPAAMAPQVGLVVSSLKMISKTCTTSKR